MTARLLCQAAERGDGEIVATLLEKGANPNEFDEEHNGTALDVACRADKVTIARTFLSHLRDHDDMENVDMSKALEDAWVDGYADIVRLLLDAGATVDEEALQYKLEQESRSENVARLMDAWRKDRRHAIDG